ncbi:hypothetical protein [Shewanella sp. KT0246]|uniref:hypothetical protein n=1 Tax=Shewanella sp. KT0246 TaxID=2815912 RepID=UPI001BB9A613|nr:hypothetical protein [Shewanella sp. KT0246]GIU49521.1 hypothetical protein TUM4249_07450 [Shewanella sp. KT0246]
MKKLLIYVLLGFCAYKAWQDFGPKDKLPPLYNESYVAVYGRDSCGHTQGLLKKLRQEGIEPYYFVVDDPEVASNLHQRMETQGISSKRYNLPVVDVNANLIIRPSPSQVQQNYYVNK